MKPSALPPATLPPNPRAPPPQIVWTAATGAAATGGGGGDGDGGTERWSAHLWRRGTVPIRWKHELQSSVTAPRIVVRLCVSTAQRRGGGG